MALTAWQLLLRRRLCRRLGRVVMGRPVRVVMMLVLVLVGRSKGGRSHHDHERRSEHQNYCLLHLYSLRRVQMDE